MLALNTGLQRLQELYEWGHKTREQYLREYESVKAEIAKMTPTDERGRELGRLAEFLGSVATAWDAATQEQRNKLARTLFEEIWSEDATVAAVKPRPELEPFFRLNLECQSKDIAVATPTGFEVSCAIHLPHGGAIPGKPDVLSERTEACFSYRTRTLGEAPDSQLTATGSGIWRISRDCARHPGSFSTIRVGL